MKTTYKTLSFTEYLEHLKTSGSSAGCRQGFLSCVTYDELVDTLGEPTHESNNYEEKVTCEWVTVTNKGVEIRIYNYKDYADHRGTTDWNIGGTHTEIALDFVRDQFPGRVRGNY